MSELKTCKLNWNVTFLLIWLCLCKLNFYLDLKGEKIKESANKEANSDFQKENQTGTFKEETKDPTDFMSISSSSSDETIAPSTSKQKLK